MALSTQSNFADPDSAYRLIVEAHRGLSDAHSAALDAALVLVLANHIGDADVLREAIELAKRRLPDQNRHFGARERSSSEPGTRHETMNHSEVPGSRPAGAVRAPERQ